MTHSREQKWQAKLIRTEAKLDSDNNMLHAVARIPEPFNTDHYQKKPLVIGQYVKARIKGKKLINRIMIPRGKVYKDHYVYIVKKGFIHKQEIKIGWRDSDFVEITSGLESGDNLVITELGDVYSGTPVEIIK